MVVEERQVDDVVVCYGAGPRTDIGWALDIARHVEANGVSLTAAPALGCSSGAWIAAAVALGITDEALVRDALETTDPRPGALVEAARSVFGDVAIPSLSVVAAVDGDATPVVLPCGNAPAALVIAASAATPGVFSPVDLAGTRFVDGVCAGSTTHAGNAPDGELLIVIAPSVDNSFERGIARWRYRNPKARVAIITRESVTVRDRTLSHVLVGAGRS